jgi:hypothetical protein
MMTRLALFALVAQSLLGTSSAFSARSVAAPISTKTQLHASAGAFMSESEAAYMMAKARECAYSDSCSIEESREHLHDILNIQVACASGAVGSADLCEGDQQAVAEVVARLRAHTEGNRHGLTTRQQMWFGALPMTFLALTTLSMLLVNTGHVNGSPDVVPFTLEEIGWAIKGGYLDDVAKEFMKHGGYFVGAEGKDAVPFTSKELVMAIQGGYLDDFIGHYFRNGGL